ncbi:MAG: hypothetical protein N4A62_05840 [Marinisporobacter sp.]|jgi:hypothetical protein|nr:hypothetical protein [Marinisporobacter sp.]
MELALLIARIILLIVQGLSAAAVGQVAGESGADFAELWSLLPSKYK